MNDPDINRFDLWNKFFENKEKLPNDKNLHERKQSEWQLDRPLFKIPLSQMPVLSPYINRVPSGVVSDLSNRIAWP